MPDRPFRQYRRTDVVAFRRTGEAFGGLSNMAPGFPITVAGHRVHTAEALYQACRFPHLPEVQRMILGEKSPMTAKMRSKPFRSQSRADWDDVRVRVMKWCLRAKLAANWSRFSGLLLSTQDRPIVEDSSKDDFWGAMPQADGILTGENTLGRLLMQLRQQIVATPDRLHSVAPLRIAQFLLLSDDIGTVHGDDGARSNRSSDPSTAPSRQAVFL